MLGEVHLQYKKCKLKNMYICFIGFKALLRRDLTKYRFIYDNLHINVIKKSLQQTKNPSKEYY